MSGVMYTQRLNDFITVTGGVYAANTMYMESALMISVVRENCLFALMTG